MSYSAIKLIESGEFVLSSPDGGATWNTTLGTLVNTSGSGPGSVWTLTVVTQKKFKLGFFSVLNVNQNRISDGRSDGIIQNSQASSGGGGGGGNQSNCIYINDGTDGWTGQVLLAGITPTSFDIVFTQINSGLDISGQFHLEVSNN